MSLSLEVLRAEHGDCLLLVKDDDLILIDGGPPIVWGDTLKPRLQELIAERPQPLFLRMVMVSHIDDDHIGGLMTMFAEAVDRMENRLGPPGWTAEELWLNAFGALTGASPTAGAGDAHGAALGELVAAAPGSESQAIAASIPGGIALHEDAIALGINRNSSFGGGLVEGGGVVEVVPGLEFTVVCPEAPRLERLRTKWQAWENKHAAKEAANIDRSVFNLSSIVVLARAGERTLLLTGDARSDDIVAGLSGQLPLTVDVLKLPHHGSSRNVDPTFFEQVKARNYVISGNGRDGNPEDATLQMLVDSRVGDDEPWTLWLTYGKADGDGKPGLKERMDAFCAAHPEVDVRIAMPGERHVIPLD